MGKMKGLGATAQMDGLDEPAAKIEDLWVRVNAKMEEILRIAKRLEGTLGK